jgi:DhnA family fructose-bisphosphate aldolase class Ia
MADPVRSLDRKLAAIHANPNCREFILADAKDADMAFGVAAPWRGRSRGAYLDNMRELVAADALDILLTSASNGERVASDGSLDDEVTLAVRANDTTDIWNHRGSSYTTVPSRPFRTADLAAVRPFCDLVLYSVTFNNDVERDIATLEAYGAFRREAVALGMRYFLEIFNPNAPVGLAAGDVGAFVNDAIIRTLAGVTAAHRPLFLKMPYNGADALTELVEHDPSVVVGILGGSAGTTRDTFELLDRAQRHGARVALFGRKIQRAESQRDLVGLMRPVLRGELSPADAVRAYHDALAKAELTPQRALADDLEVTDPVLRAE